MAKKKSKFQERLAEELSAKRQEKLKVVKAKNPQPKVKKEPEWIISGTYKRLKR